MEAWVSTSPFCPPCWLFHTKSRLLLLALAAVVWVSGCSTASVLEPGAPPQASSSGPMAAPISSVSSRDCSLGTCPVAAPIVTAGVSVSFKNDLVPALQRNCNDAPCHGSVSGSGADLYLSEPAPAVVDSGAMLARLVGIPSKTDPSLHLVEPGDPARSFLVAKVEGCQEKLGFSCTRQARASAGSGPCGDTMPQGQRPLCNRDRELLQFWILAGAKDN